MPEAKRETKTILAAIRDSLLVGPKSVYELSKELEANWDTIKNNVALLKDLGVVDIQENKVLILKIKRTSKDTMAGFPISPENKKKVYALAKKIHARWKDETSNTLMDTVLQKALVEVAESFPKMGIPRGWYLYGKVVLVKVQTQNLDNQDYKYDFGELVDQKKLNQKIDEIVKRFSTMSLREIVNEQYNQNEFYQIKNKIKDILFSDNLEDKKNELSKLLYELVFAFKKEKNDELNDEVFMIMKDSVTLILKRINDESFWEGVGSKSDLMDSFNALWKLVALYNLYNTCEGDIGYDRSIVKSFFEERININKFELIDLYEELGFLNVTAT